MGLIPVGDSDFSLSHARVDLYQPVLKQLKILPVSALIQCEAERAKTKLFVLGLKMAAV